GVIKYDSRNVEVLALQGEIAALKIEVELSRVHSERGPLDRVEAILQFLVRNERHAAVEERGGFLADLEKLFELLLTHAADWEFTMDASYPPASFFMAKATRLQLPRAT